jgi:nucleotide sugar dehydrogenase
MGSKTVLVVGAGFVGLSTAALLASDLTSYKPDRIVIFDRDLQRIRSHVEAIATGDDLLGEPDLCRALRPTESELAMGARCPIEFIEPDSGNSNQLAGLIEKLKPHLVVCAANTPLTRDGSHELYMENVVAVARQVAASLVSFISDDKDPMYFVIRSSCQPAAIFGFEELFERSPYKFAVIPEFLREGRCVDDTFSPERIVIGARADHYRLRNWFSPRSQNGPMRGEPYYLNPYEAALVKIAGNAFLATKAQFAHAVARLGSFVADNDFDAHRVLAAIGGDSRIGAAFLRPSLGIGGSCLPKDFMAFGAEVDTWMHSTRESHLFQTTREFASRIAGLNPNRSTASEPKVWIYGAGFKPESPDPRESPAVLLASILTDLGFSITMIDRRTSDARAFEAVDVDGKRIPRENYCSRLILQSDRFSDEPSGDETPEVLVINMRIGAPALGIMEAMMREKKVAPQKTFAVIDPHCGVNSSNVSCLRAAGIRYLGLGRGAKWEDRRS